MGTLPRERPSGRGKVPPFPPALRFLLIAASGGDPLPLAHARSSAPFPRFRFADLPCAGFTDDFVRPRPRPRPCHPRGHRIPPDLPLTLRVNHPDTADAYLDGLRTPSVASPPPRLVQGMDGTQRSDPYTSPSAGTPLPSADPDSLFGSSVAYQTYRKEKPEHRMMLWLRLQGHNVRETAALTGYTPQSVSQICKQPWFVEAFCRLSKEVGKDAVTTFLEGEVLPALQRTLDLAKNAEADAVRLAANREILDRFLGKSVAKVESKVSGQIDTVVYDAEKLMEEERRNAEILRSRGIISGGQN